MAELFACSRMYNVSSQITAVWDQFYAYLFFSFAGSKRESISNDLMMRYTPEKLAGTRIIATTPPAPFPPLVTGHDVDDALVARMKTAVSQAHQEPTLQQVLQIMMIKNLLPLN